MVLMDLSKTYDCLPHDLLIAKRKAYGFGIYSLKLIYNYLTEREQRVKIGTAFSSWKQYQKEFHRDLCLASFYSKHL